MQDYVGALEWCFMYHYSRDSLRSAERLRPVKYSPLTVRLAMCLNEAVSVAHADIVQHVLESVTVHGGGDVVELLPEDGHE